MSLFYIPGWVMLIEARYENAQNHSYVPYVRGSFLNSFTWTIGRSPKLLTHFYRY